MTNVKYTKKMIDYLTTHGIDVQPKDKNEYSNEAIQFFQDQNDFYEFTIEETTLSGSFTNDMMDLNEADNSDYFID